MKKHYASSVLILACAVLLGLTSCESRSHEPPSTTRASPLQTPLPPTLELEPTAPSDTWPTV